MNHSSSPHNSLTRLFIFVQYFVNFLLKASPLILLFILFQSSVALPARTKFPSNRQAMKVHPAPRKRNITIQYHVNGTNSLSEPQALMGLNNKKLRRLPHVFSRVLELPFRSDADVIIEENPDCFRFVAETENIGDVHAHAVEIHPGVTKIVVRESGSVELALDELELDMWRFRLPETTRPELASAVFVDGELIVTVPKGEEELENSDEGDGNGGGEMWSDGNGNFGGRGMGGRLVLVQ